VAGHVAGVLLMAGCIGDDEFAPRGGEVTIGHIDGDALLALGAEAVGEQRKVQAAGRLIRGDLADGGQLVFVDAFGIVEQPPDEGALTIGHAAGRGEAEKLGLAGGKSPAGFVRGVRDGLRIVQTGSRHQK
jgi:hypothetical protein